MHSYMDVQMIIYVHGSGIQYNDICEVSHKLCYRDEMEPRIAEQCKWPPENPLEPLSVRILMDSLGFPSRNRRGSLSLSVVAVWRLACPQGCSCTVCCMGDASTTFSFWPQSSCIVVSCWPILQTSDQMEKSMPALSNLATLSFLQGRWCYPWKFLRTIQAHTEWLFLFILIPAGAFILC